MPRNNRSSRPEERALKRLRAKRKFRNQLRSFITGMTVLFIINLTVSPSVWWFKWALFGWGIAIVMEFFKSYGSELFGDDDAWEERSYSRSLEQEQRRSGQPSRIEEDILELEERPTQQRRSPQWRERDMV